MLIDLSGKKFGKLLVVKYLGSSKWKCKCECGNETIVRSDYLKTGHTQSCGCLHNKYGGNVKNDRLYRLYRGIIQRTTILRKDNHNHTYIEKGIVMCDDWRNDFNKFKEWALENRYDYLKTANEQTIDRIDNNKGYCPENCRFISRKENNQNVHKKKGIICLSKEQQLEILHLYKNRLSSRKIAEKYKVSKTTIMNVIRLHTRKELEDETIL